MGGSGARGADDAVVILAAETSSAGTTLPLQAPPGPTNDPSATVVLSNVGVNPLCTSVARSGSWPTDDTWKPWLGCCHLLTQVLCEQVNLLLSPCIHDPGDSRLHRMEQLPQVPTFEPLLKGMIDQKLIVELVARSALCPIIAVTAQIHLERTGSLACIPLVLPCPDPE